MIFVFTPTNTARLRHSFELLFKSILKIEVSITDNLDEWNSYSGVKISYGHKNPETSKIHFTSSNLLFERDIHHQKVKVEIFQEIPTLFQVEDGILPFDPFAATFYLTSRYEEYISDNLDKHGRYLPENSIAYKHKFLTTPVVNYYAQIIKEIISAHYPLFAFPKKEYRFIPTIDIDTAYAYKYKSNFHKIGGLLKCLLMFDFEELRNRLRVHLKMDTDPYDSYFKQEAIHKKYTISPIYFILMGDRGKFDRNLHHKSFGQRKVIKQVKLLGNIGLHPSYKSNNSDEMIGIEKARLEEVSGQKITQSRQHYLKIKFPFTYQRLLKANITDDYSMGYASKIGFRASICTPFYFYDLSTESQTELLIHPFFAMDTTLKKYMKVSSNNVVNKLIPLFDHVKYTKGEAVIIFHNESIGGRFKHWKRWGNIYENVIQLGLTINN
jgi:hypothetical protein